MIFRFLFRAWGFSLLLGLNSPAYSQSASFSLFSETGSGGYNSGVIYATMSQATEALFSRATMQSGAGAYLEPWALSGGSYASILFRVRNQPVESHYIVQRPYHSGPTPESACESFAAENGAAVTRVYLHPSGTPGRRRYVCEYNIPGYGVRIQDMHIRCTSPFSEAENEDGVGALTCGWGMLGLVSSTDAGSERPDQCPAEGNPILPNSAQKVEYDTDYDNGQALSFRRSYGSQRIGIGPSAALTHSFSANLPGRSGSGINRRADGTVFRMVRNFATDQWSSASADTPYRIVATGVYPNQTFNIVSFSEPTSEQYDASGRLTLRSSANGVAHRVTYANGAGGYLPGGPICVLPTGVTAPTQFAPLGALQCVTDPFGRQLNFFVDTKARVIKLIDPAGQAIEYRYDEASSYVAPSMQPGNNLTSVQYQDGYARRYHYNEPAYTVGGNSAKALTGVSELIPPAADFTRFSTFAYDAQGRAISTERSGGIMRHSMSYASGANQVSVTDPIGTTRTHAFSTLLNVSRRVSTQQPAGSGSSACSDTLTYDAQANVTSRVDFNGNKICYAYDPMRRVETKRVEGLPATADCSSALSNPPANAKVITTEWHPYWRLPTRVAEPKKISTSIYNDNGATCAPTDALVDGRPIAVVCTRTEQGTTDETGAAGFGATAAGTPRAWSYTYASLGRVLTATDPNSKTTVTTYHADDDADLGKRGNTATVTNPAGHVTEYTDYNSHGKAIRIADANGFVTTNVYDARLRLRSRTVGQRATLFDYHPAGHLTRATMPDGSTLTYAYDDAHRLTSVQDQKGNRIVYTLNALGSRTSEQVRDPGGALVQNIGRVVDALNRFERITGQAQQPSAR